MTKEQLEELRKLVEDIVDANGCCGCPRVDAAHSKLDDFVEQLEAVDETPNA